MLFKWQGDISQILCEVVHTWLSVREFTACESDSSSYVAISRSGRRCEAAVDRKGREESLFSQCWPWTNWNRPRKKYPRTMKMNSSLARSPVQNARSITFFPPHIGAFRFFLGYYIGKWSKRFWRKFVSRSESQTSSKEYSRVLRQEWGVSTIHHFVSKRKPTF